MAAEKLTSIPLTDVAKTRIVTRESTAKTYSFETSDEIGTEEVVSEGEEQTLKIKGKIWANKKAEDTTLGHDLTVKNNVFIPEVVKVLQGGTLTTATEGGEFLRYEAPAIGETVTKVKFDFEVYSEEVAPDGPTGRYAKITFPNCQGSKCPISFKDGEYFASEMVIKSRPAKGEKPYIIEMVDALPAD